MLKTNTRKARENVRAYIEKNYSPENYGKAEESATTFEEKARFIYGEFRRATDGEYYRRTNEQENFIDWCSGLPSLLDTCYFYNRSAVDDLGEILEETDEEKNKYTERQAERLLTILIYREIRKAVKK